MSDGEKEQVKSVFVGLMLSMPPKLQAQLSEALVIISRSDFPRKWETLLPELLGHMASTDYAVINGVLTTADTIFLKYKGAFKTVELVEEINLLQETFVRPLLALLQRTSAAVGAAAADAHALRPLLTAVLHICSIFYSLNNMELHGARAPPFTPFPRSHSLTRIPVAPPPLPPRPQRCSS